MTGFKQKIQALRRQWITKPAFAWFCRALPPLSATEKQAITAGDVGIEQSLFQGTPNWSEILDTPSVKLSEAEKAFMNGPVSRLCEMLDDWAIVEVDKDLPPAVWTFIQKERFLGIIIPESYGGLGFSALAHSSVIAQIASKSITAAVTCMVPNALGPGELLVQYGTDEQKAYYLPRLALGKEIPCFALTGPEAGSDAGSMPDKGIVCRGMYQNQNIIGIKLNFDKRYITLAPIATVMGLAFNLSDPEKLLGDNGQEGITVCLIPTDHPGITIGKRHNALDIPFMNGPIQGKDVFIPLDWIIGGQTMAGQGWQMLVESLAAGRGISLPALSTATAQVAYRMTGAYALIRRQFKTSLSDFDGICAALARIGGYTYMLEATRVFVASTISKGMHPAVATSIAKYHMTEIARKISNDAMDVHGGKGIMVGPHNYLARAYQATPIGITVEGANILTRCLIIFGQGAFRCHPYVQAEMDSAALSAIDYETAVDNFDRAFRSHLKYSIKNKARSFILGLSFGFFSRNVPKKDLPKGFCRMIQKINWMSAGLAFTSDAALAILGGKLKRKELLSARLGDVLSALYLSSCVLKYAIDTDPKGKETHYMQWTLQTLLFEAQEAFYDFFQNAPHWGLKCIRWIIFPWGRVFSRPTDALGKKLIHEMITDNPLRDRLTTLCFIKENEAKGIIEAAFQKRLAIENILEKIHQGVKNKSISGKIGLMEQANEANKQDLISPDELIDLNEYQLLYQKAIAVDEFTALRNKDNR